jgi:transcriptional regulator with XRE-family HTH domain
MKKIKLNEYLRQARINVGLSQKEVSDHLKYGNAQFISNIERDLCSPPLKMLKSLIKLYDLDKKEVIQIIINETEKKIKTALN